MSYKWELVQSQEDKPIDEAIPTSLSELQNDVGYITGEDLPDLGVGDMAKSTYDTDEDGKVDTAEQSDKLTNPRAISLSGDASGSATFDGSQDITINVVVADDSHNHIINNIDGLQTALDGKVSVVAGKGLSTNDYTTVEKTKLSGIEAGAEVNNISDTNVTDLTDGGDSTLHYHSTDRNRANHTGTQLASTISDFAATVRATVLTGLSTATNAAISATDNVLGALGKLQAQINGHTSNTSNPHSVTKSQVGLGNVDNTSDLAKPISTATQTALDGKVSTISGKGLSTNDYTDAEKTKLSGIEANAEVNNISDTNVTDLTDAGDTSLHYHSTDRNRSNHTGTQLASTISDFAGAVRASALTSLSIATNSIISATDSVLSALGKLQAQITANLSTLTTHTGNTSNPHSVTKSQVGLGNVDNTSDVNKPISTATQTALDNKVDKVAGKQLSTEDYTTAEKTKLTGVATGATANDTDANLKNRANHTGTQLASTISDFAATARAVVLTGLSTATNSVISATDSILTALGKLQAQITSHTGNVSNPHSVTKTQVGLGNVDNTSDINKPVSTATQNALNGKANTEHDHVVADIADFPSSLPANGGDADTVGGLSPLLFRQKQSQYVTTTAAAEGYYRVAQIPMTSQFKNAMFKVKAYTATGTTTESTIFINMAYYSGNYSSQVTSVSANTSHSCSSSTSAENGYVLLYCRVSFDANYGYIDLYKYKTTAVTMEIEPLMESDWVWETGALTVNPTVGAYRNTSVTLESGLKANAMSASYASYCAYAQYGTLGSQTISNTTDKTNQWQYFGNFYIQYNSSYLRGHSGNVRVRIQEVCYDGSKSPTDMDDFIVTLKVNMPYHADSTAFNTTVPTFSVEIEASDGKCSISTSDICGLVYSTSTSTKYIRYYIKTKSANMIYCINPEQRYGRSFATSTYSQTTSYCYFNYAGDQASISSLPTPAQGSVVYATRGTINIDYAVDGTTNKVYTTTEQTKLAGIETGAEVNNITDANATDLTDNGDTTLHYHSADRNRSNHTGTQLASTISDFAVVVRSTVLTGLSTATNAVITTTDTVLGALGKIQAQITSHTGNTNNPHSVTKTQVGLGNVDNTSDVSKPVSTATQTALNLKAPLASPALTGTPTAPTATAGTNTTQIATTAFVQGAVSSAGGGDMMKATYDTDDDGKVDSAENSDTVNGHTVLSNVPSGAVFTDTVTTINGKTGAIAKADITALGIPAQDTVTTINGKTGAIAKADIVALGIPAQDTVYVHPATTSADEIVDGTVNKAYTATEKTKLAGIESGATADMTASEILTALKTVDGSGSGLDADTLRGNAPTAFAPSGYGLGTALVNLALTSASTGKALETGMYFLSSTATDKPPGITDCALLVMAHSASWVTQLGLDWRTNKIYTRVCTNGVWSAWSKPDADLLGGKNPDDYLSRGTTTITTQDWNTLKDRYIYFVTGATGANFPTGAYPYGTLTVLRNDMAVSQMYQTHSGSELWIRSTWDDGRAWEGWRKVWNSANTGAGTDYTTKRPRNIALKTGADFTTSELGNGEIGYVYE